MHASVQMHLSWPPRIWLGSLILSLLLTTGCAVNGNAFENRSYERSEIKQMIREEAKRMRVPVSLALAVAHAESNFDPKAKSSKGARGVMQIMPATARSEYGIPAHMLWNPRVNIRIGLHFLRRLTVRYRGRVDLALSYYNGGSAVGKPPTARVIPATARYVAKVKRLQTHYRARLREGRV